MQAVSLNAMNFVLGFVVNVYRRCCAAQPIATPLPQQADMKHWVYIAQSSVRRQIKLVSHLTNSLLYYKLSYVSVFELTLACEVQVASAQKDLITNCK